MLINVALCKTFFNNTGIQTTCVKVFNSNKYLVTFLLVHLHVLTNSLAGCLLLTPWKHYGCCVNKPWFSIKKLRFYQVCPGFHTETGLRSF